MYVFIHGGVNCLNSVPYRCYMYVEIIAIGSIGQLSDCSSMSFWCMLAHVHSLCPVDLALLVGYVALRSF